MTNKEEEADNQDIASLEYVIKNQMDYVIATEI